MMNLSGQHKHNWFNSLEHAVGIILLMEVEYPIGYVSAIGEKIIQGFSLDAPVALNYRIELVV